MHDLRSEPMTSSVAALGGSAVRDSFWDSIGSEEFEQWQSAMIIHSYSNILFLELFSLFFFFNFNARVNGNARSVIVLSLLFLFHVCISGNAQQRRRIRRNNQPIVSISFIYSFDASLVFSQRSIEHDIIQTIFGKIVFLSHHRHHHPISNFCWSISL